MTASEIIGKLQLTAHKAPLSLEEHVEIQNLARQLRDLVSPEPDDDEPEDQQPPLKEVSNGPY